MDPCWRWVFGVVLQSVVLFYSTVLKALLQRALLYRDLGTVLSDRGPIRLVLTTNSSIRWCSPPTHLSKVVARGATDQSQSKESLEIG